MIKASNAGAGSSEHFGEAVSISGTYAIVGRRERGSYIYEPTVTVTGGLTSLSFATNTLTIENTIIDTDSDNVSYALPSGKKCDLVLTTFNGHTDGTQGTISYTLSSTDGSSSSGSFTNSDVNSAVINTSSVSGDTVTLTFTTTDTSAIGFKLEGIQTEPEPEPEPEPEQEHEPEQ